MKKTIACLIAVFVTAAWAVAGYRMVSRTCEVTYGATNTYQIAGVIGKPVAVAIGGSTNLTVAIVAKDGFGLSLNGDRSIYAAADIASTNVTPTAVLMYLDLIEISVTGSNGVTQVKILLED